MSVKGYQGVISGNRQRGVSFEGVSSSNHQICGVVDLRLTSNTSIVETVTHLQLRQQSAYTFGVDQYCPIQMTLIQAVRSLLKGRESS
jgi:hypothetical protein